MSEELNVQESISRARHREFVKDSIKKTGEYVFGPVTIKQEGDGLFVNGLPCRNWIEVWERESRIVNQGEKKSEAD